LPFILVAAAGVKADDRATADIASDRMTASDFIFLSLDLWPAHTITGIPLNKQAFSSQPPKSGPCGLNRPGPFPPKIIRPNVSKQPVNQMVYFGVIFSN
jgi:hypothetical protein